MDQQTTRVEPDRSASPTLSGTVAAHPNDDPASRDGRETWADPRLPVDVRVADLVARMTLEEKLAQLGGVWVRTNAGGERVAPDQDDFAAGQFAWDEVIREGIGQVTRVFGTAPADPVTAAGTLEQIQRDIVRASRFGIPALAHEECLAGFMTWGATIFPVPLAWGASFDPELVGEMAAAIGDVMRRLGVHQGLAPVLDVVRDLRWGRVEETCGEDPYLVGVVGTAYVRGLEGAGIVATMKHFAGYAASRAGRNLAPVSMGPREFADVVLPPFEMALREGGARSAMASYTETDGVPATGDPLLLTTLLRDQLGFAGVVVSDYFAISQLETLHAIAPGPGEAGTLALSAGVDMELPSLRCFGTPLAEKVRGGAVPVELVDRAVTRVLRQKCELGLLDPDWSARPPALAAGAGEVNLDPPEHRALARRMAEESVVLLANPHGALPLGRQGKVAVVGPLADDPLAMMGCYGFPLHVGSGHPGLPMGVSVDSVLDAVRDGVQASEIRTARGCDVREPDRSGLFEAVTAARDADLCIAVLGDRSGLFGKGTSGEGCDAADLRLPGVQAELLDAVLDTGTPVVLVLISGRPYALGNVVDRLAAAVQVFLPGEEGAAAVVDVLCGRVNPSGRLPVSLPDHPGGQPGTYLGPRLGQRHQNSAQDPTPLFPFGHGLSYTSFRYDDLRVEPVGAPVQDGEGRDGAAVPVVGVDGTVEISAVVTNVGARDGVEVAQLYLHDPAAQVTRPVRQLVGFARVPLPAGRSARVRFRVHADRTSFTGRDGRRLVEPGLVEVHVGRSSADTPLSGRFLLAGPPRTVGHDRVLDTPTTVEPLSLPPRTR